MVSYQRTKTLGRYGAQLSAPTVTSFTFPASVGGVNAVDSLMMMPAEDSIYSYNLMPSEYGMQLRKGYKEWATNCIDDATKNHDIRTILPFESNSQLLEFNKLFGVTSEGIWDITISGQKQTSDKKAAFSTSTGAAGFGVSCEFTNDANAHYLFYADGENGLWQYQQSTNTWSVPPSGTANTDWHTKIDATTNAAFPVDDIVYVMVFKQRIWVILKNDNDAYYLGIASVTGELKKFTFGAKMPHGGNLQALYNWTLDSGIGVDDIMVAVGRGGDVILYQGSDPEQIWEARGIYFVGETPASRRIAENYGPDLYILSTYGLVSLNTLLRGDLITGQGPAKKITRFLRTDVKNGKNLFDWQLVVNPSDGFLQIVTPSPSSTPYLQYNMNTQTGAWGFWEGVPIIGANSWSGEYYIGSKNGIAYIYDGLLDGTEINKPNLFQDSSVAPIGTGWTVPTALEFQCDGTQVAETQYNTTLVSNLVQDDEYVVSYSIKVNPGSSEVLGNHSIIIQNGNVQEPLLAAGTFSFTFKASAVASEMALVGDANFVGTFFNVNIRKVSLKGEAISFRNLTSFQAPVGTSRFSRVGFIRSIGLIEGSSSIRVQAIYDYNILDIVPPAISVPNASGYLWDSAVWGVPTTWDSSLKGKSFINGALGLGNSFAVGMSGSANTRINVLGWDVLFNSGGYL